MIQIDLVQWLLQSSLASLKILFLGCAQKKTFCIMLQKFVLFINVWIMYSKRNKTSSPSIRSLKSRILHRSEHDSQQERSRDSIEENSRDPMSSSDSEKLSSTTILGNNHRFFWYLVTYTSLFVIEEEIKSRLKLCHKQIHFSYLCKIKCLTETPKND